MEVMALKISKHALDQFHFQTRYPHHKALSDQEICDLLLFWWDIGVEQSSSQYGFATKFLQYGFEDSEHRRAAGWVLTRASETIVTVHYKTKQEKRRDKKRRLKENQRKKQRR